MSPRVSEAKLISALADRVGDHAKKSIEFFETKSVVIIFCNSR